MNINNIDDLSDDELEEYLGSFSEDELAALQDMISMKRNADYSDVSNSVYKCHCPTPKEFLEEWLDADTYSGLFPFVRDMFVDIWDYESNYDEVVLYGATRLGKTVIARLSVVYSIVFLWCLRDPHRFYGINPMSSLSIFVMCFSKKKAQMNLLGPIFRIIERSPKFLKVKLQDTMNVMQEKVGTDKIVWTTATKDAEAVFFGGIMLNLGSSPLDIIGADIVMAIVTEINFFIESVGVTEDDVWRVYTDTKDRILGTIGNKYGAFILLDSSANSRDSKIEKYILEEAVKRKGTYFKSLRRWEARPSLYPQWQETGETFKVFIGDNTRDACLVDENFKYDIKDPALFIDVPIDGYDRFKFNIHKSLKDQAGIPSGTANRFFPDLTVLDHMWDPLVTAITHPLEAPMMMDPKDLIMSSIKELLFKRDMNGNWRLKRSATAPRWFHVDTSENSDYMGLCLLHPEVNNRGSIIAVTDILIDIRPTVGGINLESILQFVRELYNDYGVNIIGVSSDRHQSSFFKQGILRDNRLYKLISVDTEKAPYLLLKSKIFNGHVKCGFYSNVLNNFRCLIDVGNKIEHTTGGSSKGRATDKEVGMHSKDISDALAGAVHGLFSEIDKVSISHNYDDINELLNLRKQAFVSKTITEKDKTLMMDNLMKNIERNKNGVSHVGV